MGTFIFGIKGLAACYRKPDEKFWNIVFPTDKDHKVELYWIKNGVKDGPEYLADRKVNITVSGGEERADDDFQYQSFEDVLDLTTNYLHANGLARRPIEEQQKNEDGEPMVGRLELQIPDAKLFSCAPRENRLNFVFPFDKPADIQLITKADGRPKIFPTIVGGVISLMEDGEITINIGEGQNIINLKEGDTFFINNDCDGESIRNDFQHYQDLFVSPDPSDRRFEMISLYDSPNPEPQTDMTCSFNEEPFFNISILEPFLKNFNKDINTEPPPRICDTVRISKTDLLR
jgi:hypothetical protein